MQAQRQVSSAEFNQSCLEFKSTMLLTFSTIYSTGAAEAENSLRVLPADQSQDNPTLQSGNSAEVDVKQEPVHSQTTDSYAD